MSTQSSVSKIISLVLRGMAMAMGITAVVISGLQVGSPQTTGVLLGIGLSALALDALDREKED